MILSVQPPDRSPSGAPGAPGAWVALHVHYAANPRPLLVHCVRRVFDELTDRDLVESYFFVNYWLEGPHVRLRFKPRQAAHTAAATRLAEARVQAYLHRRPALYDVDTGFLGELYQRLFAMELTAEEQARHLAADGTMQVRPNNAIVRAPYVPEDGKYGGRAGVAIAEWHFRHSSDLVLEAMRSQNLHLRPVLLGTAAQLMMVMTASFLGHPDRVAAFLRRYHDFWRSHFAGTGFIADDDYRRGIAGNAAAIERQFARVLGAAEGGETGSLPPLLARWAQHCDALRDRVVRQVSTAPMTFGPPAAPRRQVVTEPGTALALLLSPYLHMTNNRLHVTIRDEAYLAHLLGAVVGGGSR